MYSTKQRGLGLGLDLVFGLCLELSEAETKAWPPVKAKNVIVWTLQIHNISRIDRHVLLQYQSENILVFRLGVVYTAH